MFSPATGEFSKFSDPYWSLSIARQEIKANTEYSGFDARAEEGEVFNTAYFYQTEFLEIFNKVFEADKAGQSSLEFDIDKWGFDYKSSIITTLFKLTLNIDFSVLSSQNKPAGQTFKCKITWERPNHFAACKDALTVYEQKIKEARPWEF